MQELTTLIPLELILQLQGWNRCARDGHYFRLQYGLYTEIRKTASAHCRSLWRQNVPTLRSAEEGHVPAGGSKG